MGQDQLTAAGKTRQSKASHGRPRWTRLKDTDSAATVSQMQPRDCDSQLWRLGWQKGRVATKSRPNWSIFLPGSRRAVTSYRRSIPSFISPQHKSTSHGEQRVVICIQLVADNMVVSPGIGSFNWVTFWFVIRLDHPAEKKIDKFVDGLAWLVEMSVGLQRVSSGSSLK